MKEKTDATQDSIRSSDYHEYKIRATLLCR